MLNRWQFNLVVALAAATLVLVIANMVLFVAVRFVRKRAELSHRTC